MWSLHIEIVVFGLKTQAQAQLSVALACATNMSSCSH